jgi:transposase IS116/IS110/IS902 family protein
LRRIDDQLRQTRRKLTAAVHASGTSLTGIFGVGPVIAATVIGDAGDARRCPSADRFAAYNGTAPIEFSAGSRQVYRLSRRGNRCMNHAIHVAVVTQIRNQHRDGRACYDRKIKEGKTRQATQSINMSPRPQPVSRTEVRLGARHTRTPMHPSFEHGPHFWLGAALAKTEAEIRVRHDGAPVPGREPGGQAAVTRYSDLTGA